MPSGSVRSVQLQEAHEKSTKGLNNHTDLSSLVWNENEHENARVLLKTGKIVSKPIPFPTSTQKIEEIERIKESHSDLVHIYNQSTWQMYWRYV